MGVTREYFVCSDDEEGAELLNSAEQGVLGVCPITELVSLEALLLGLSPDGSAVATLMRRPDHDVIVAHDHDEPWNVVVNRVADDTAALIAGTVARRLAGAMPLWSQTPEFAGYVSAAELSEVMQALQPLFQRAVAQQRHVYVRTSC